MIPSIWRSLARPRQLQWLGDSHTKEQTSCSSAFLESSLVSAFPKDISHVFPYAMATVAAATFAMDRMTPQRLAERDPLGEVASWLQVIAAMAGGSA